MAKYKVKHTTILHNKKAYAEDSVIELKEEDAVRLADFLELIPETTANNKQQNKKNENKTGEKQDDKGGQDGEKTV